MAKKIMFSGEEKEKIIETYLSGKSTTETGRIYNITSRSVSYILKKANVKTRTVAEGNSLKWNDVEFRNNQVSKKIGKPSSVLGKTWTISHIIKRPSTTGEKNHFWKGGKTKLSQSIKNLAEYSIWRLEIFRRDWFTCQICGAKNKVGEKYIFDADHIYPFHKILDDFNIQTIEEAISCEKLWDITNGRCLCRNCHKQTNTWGVNKKK